MLYSKKYILFKNLLIQRRFTMKNKLVYICIMSLLLFVVGCSNNPNKESTIKKDSKNNQSQVKEEKENL